MISFKCSDKCTKNNSDDEYDSITKGQSVIYFQQEIQTIEDKVSDKTIQNCCITEINKKHSRIAKKVHKVNIHSKESKRNSSQPGPLRKKVIAFKLSN